MKQLVLFLKGVAVGVANIIPGVSGGTIAFITGIYDELMESIGRFFSNKSKRKSYFIFLFVVGAGAVVGIVLFARLLSFLLAHQAMPTYLFFFGLIAGSIPFILHAHHDMKFTFSRGLSLLIGFVLVMALIIFSGQNPALTRAPHVISTFAGVFKITTISLPYAFWLVLCGFLAAGSMIIPGFSGSALLVTLGEYGNILHYVDQRMIVPVALVGIGAVLGIIVFARLIDWCLKKIPALTFYFILGLIGASFVQIGIEVAPYFSTQIMGLLISLLSLVSGFLIALFLGRIAPEKESEA